MRLVLTQGTLTFRTPTQVAQVHWRQIPLQIYVEEESILTPQQVTLTQRYADSGFVDTSQGDQVTAGVGENNLDTMPCAPVLDEF